MLDPPRPSDQRYGGKQDRTVCKDINAGSPDK